MKQCILLNGPPRSGKSTACRLIDDMFPDECSILGFSHHLKRMVHGIHLGRAGWDLDPDAFDSIKDIPQDFLGGRSWREEYIYYSEHVIKPRYGLWWLGEQFLKVARHRDRDIILVPDSGFKPEIFPTIDEIGPHNVLLIRLHKNGVTYTDSRSYIKLKDIGVVEFDVENVHGHQALMRLELKLIITKWRATLKNLQHTVS